MNRQQHALMKILQKIRVFQGLEPTAAERLLSVCKSRIYEPNQRIYNAGELSTEMLVLIQGKLKVISEAGKDLVEISPGASTGEMGVFTGHRRSATVAAVEKSAALVIQRDSLESLLKADREMKATVLQNVVDLLSDRLAEADQQIDHYMKLAESKE